MSGTANRPRSGQGIRRATAADLEAVVRIEREQFSHPWNGEYFAAELQNHRCHFWVALASRDETEPGSVVGYMVFWRIGPELELHKIAVATACQRQGHASCLLERFIQEARDMAGERAWLEVRASNVAAIRLYEKYGFRCAGRRPDYYAQPEEDALVFELVL